ncbi:hypothetical protein [Castellaniella sp.]|uniref:hypothetical protein n=1 Tax=Castellaniella sp. TaxID=1955812 RepID=UPI002AFEE781|nr:hypothetical protein [Castellaniella sp.]
MSFSQVIYLPELLHEYKARYVGGQPSMSSGFLNLIREPIRQGCGIEISSFSLRKDFHIKRQQEQQNFSGQKLANNKWAGFDVAQFRELAVAGCPEGMPLWNATYYRVNGKALDYLFEYIPQNSLVMSFDLPPWMKQACSERGVIFLDFRNSPLRFGQDVYIALHTNDETLRTRIVDNQVSKEELRLEAALLAANMGIHRGRRAENLCYYFDLEDAFIYVGQHRLDSALWTRQGRYLQCTDYAERLYELARGHRVLYLADWGMNLKPEENVETVAAQARSELSKALGLQVDPCPQSIYQVLSAHENFILAGLSAPALQEAIWFDRKNVHQMVPSEVSLDGDGISAADAYSQIHFQDFIAPGFWHCLLTPSAQLPRVARLSALSHRCGRETLELWGDYEKALTWQRTVPLAIFERSGGGLLRERVDDLVRQQARMITSNTPNKENQSVSVAEIEKLKNSKIGQTAYILGNGPSLRGFDVSDLMARESFWCNRAFEIEKSGIDFRPKYYFWADLIGAQMFLDDIIEVQAGKKFFRNSVYKIIHKNRPNDIEDQNIIHYECRESPGVDMHDSEENFSYDPTVMLFGGWTVVLDAIQFAYYMGYSKVYVGGVDLDYSKSGYFFSPEISTNPTDCALDNIRKAFLVARHHFEKGGRILAKITVSPNLPLEFMHDESLVRTEKGA